LGEVVFCVVVAGGGVGWGGVGGVWGVIAFVTTARHDVMLRYAFVTTARHDVRLRCAWGATSRVAS